jgi:Fe-S cluster assembly protein SufD
MLYKGILDKKSKAVFNGKVVVHPHAQQTNSSQTNHTLLLSNDAEVNTKPELEIYADDVKCTHGATVGQLDMESLFYLRSRGMDKDTALRTLLGAFACEVIGKISNEKIRQYIQSRVENYVEL